MGRKCRSHRLCSEESDSSPQFSFVSNIFGSSLYANRTSFFPPLVRVCMPRKSHSEYYFVIELIKEADRRISILDSALSNALVYKHNCALFGCKTKRFLLRVFVLK